MQVARTSGCVVVVVLALVISGCGGGGASRPSAVRTARSTPKGRDTTSTDPISVTTPAAVGPSAPTTTTTGAPPVHNAAPAVSQVPGPVLPSVTLAVLGGGGISQNDDHPCSNISAQTLTRGQVEAQRSGPTDGALVVRYTATGADADHGPLSGLVTIPAGAASAVIFVDPVIVDAPGPRHEHRSSVVNLSLAPDGAYVAGPASTAAVGLRFDIDLFGCNRSAPQGATSPTGPIS